MQCQNLLKHLDTMIINELLNPMNCSQFYLDAIRFDNKAISEACEILLQQNFGTISKSEEGLQFMLNIPYKYMKSICQSNSLTISNESELVTLFEKYLNHRESLPILKEEDPSLDWSHLNEEERKAREEHKKA